MTTIAEVKKWTRPILAEHQDLALMPRQLYLRPVHHIHRRIRFLGSSDRTFSKPLAEILVMFAPPSGRLSDNWSRELIVGWSTDADFHGTLAKHIRQTLKYPFRPLAEIEDLYRLMQESRLHWQHQELLPLSHDAFLHASVLASLGRLPEACAVAQAYIDKEETRWLKIRAEAEGFLKKPRTRSEGESRIQLADGFLKPMEDMRQLMALAGANDRRGVAALLRDWERLNAQRLEVEDDWEATPFPLERDL
ncbi:hypothetical protein SAMN05428969_2282 [Devosia sp. YR412]|uniref:hypothetical protein n=1 Tax=Devosia sp. YR412 TaxID=1881030 RepID=UPI0008AFB1E7|nr:hypothetical protein [Devosia sp. YR412]SEQ22468.1 hypothetical protein SAMN05428969_2282 [Devosia sp. YR412]